MTVLQKRNLSRLNNILSSILVPSKADIQIIETHFEISSSIDRDGILMITLGDASVLTWFLVEDNEPSFALKGTDFVP